MKFGIIDYGASNIFSLIYALKRLEINVEVLNKESNLNGLNAIILPGVGNFSSASKYLSLFKNRIIEALDSNVPLFGICLGLQLFFEGSEEGEGEGLSLIKGKVVRFKTNLKIPHMGWNLIRKIRTSVLLNNFNSEEWAYFAHSFYPMPEDENVIVGLTQYGIDFPSVIEAKNIFGTQFHPEKSGMAGQKILKNFIEYLKK